MLQWLTAIISTCIDTFNDGPLNLAFDFCQMAMIAVPDGSVIIIIKLHLVAFSSCHTMYGSSVR